MPLTLLNLELSILTRFWSFGKASSLGPGMTPHDQAYLRPSPMIQGIIMVQRIIRR